MYCRWATLITEIQIEISHKYAQLHMNKNAFINVKVKSSTGGGL